jgi:hypothetical protein
LKFRRVLAFLAVFAIARTAHAVNPEQPETAPKPGEDVQFIDHSGPGPLYFGAEANNILQMKPGFRAKYSGPMSLRPEGEAALSGLITAFFAYTPFKTTELIVDAEMSYGGGLSSAVGLAGFTNLDVVRNPTLSAEPYLARIQIHQLIPLTDVWEDNEDRGPISSFAKKPRHAIHLRAGKMSTADLFDINPVASDSHLQFMNWTVDNTGAYDYAADTRGYTYGAMVEYQGPWLEVRFGEMLMPKVANGLELDWDIGKNRAENFEVELKYSTRHDWAGTLRSLAYLNHANMGSYKDAIAAADATNTIPDITAHRSPGRTKAGFGLNLFQEVFGQARFFARFGWNDGRNESFAYTEVDDTFAIGGDLRGTLWHRPSDRTGIAFVSNGISGVHREYLRKGGQGFLLGDGNLNYDRETILEHYYNVHIWRGLSAAADLQVIANPGYNADRGPVAVISLRGHLEF